MPGARMSQLSVPASLRSHLLYPGCWGRYGKGQQVQMAVPQPAGSAGEAEKGLPQS